MSINTAAKELSSFGRLTRKGVLPNRGADPSVWAVVARQWGVAVWAPKGGCACIRCAGTPHSKAGDFKLPPVPVVTRRCSVVGCTRRRTRPDSQQGCSHGPGPRRVKGIGVGLGAERASRCCVSGLWWSPTAAGRSVGACIGIITYCVTGSALEV